MSTIMVCIKSQNARNNYFSQRKQRIKDLRRLNKLSFSQCVDGMLKQLPYPLLKYGISIS